MQNTIIKNTVYLYIRQLVTLFVSLYTARVVLEVLGAIDYGVYNVVAGFVSIFNVVCAALNNSTQRFLSIHKVCKDIKEVFASAFLLHVLMGVLIVLLLETLGFIGFSKLNIPSERIEAAQWVFHISVFSMFLAITQVPYNSLIIANEKMKAFSQISILEAILKLALVFAILHISFDKLKIYAILMFVSSLIVMSTYRIYCHRQLGQQISYSLKFSHKLLKSMVSFTGWSFFSSFVWVIKGQGINVLLNMFFGPTVNAARGIVNQITNIATSFMLNFQSAANPKINQYYVLGEIRRMEELTFQTIRMCFFLDLLLLIPIFIEIDFILNLWLKNPPEYAAIFCRILIIELLIDSVTGPLFTAIRATGNIIKLSIMEFSILFWNVPLTWILLKLGYGAQSAYIVSAVLTFIAVLFRHKLLFKQLPFSFQRYIQTTVSKMFITAIFAILLNLVSYIWMDRTLIGELLWCIISVIVSSISIFLCGFSIDERKKITGFIMNRIDKQSRQKD